MKQLETWLADAEVNLIGIQGLGGVGKSALAAFLYENYPPNPPYQGGSNSELTSPFLYENYPPNPPYQGGSNSELTSPPSSRLPGEGSNSGLTSPPTPQLTGEESPTPPLIRGVGGVEGLGFSHKFWADISQKPDFSYFAEQVITAFGGKVTQPGDINLLINDLLNCLNQQRCLLVIDNLETLLNWDRNWENSAYEQFFIHWVKHGKTSIILVTTQEKPVLFQPQTCWYLLQGMKTREGAILLQQFGIQGSVTQLEAFAKQVDGHPLTLELVAGFLREYCNCQLNGAKELGLEKFEELVAKAKGLHRHKQDVRLSWILQQHFQRLSSTQSSFLVDLSVYRQPFDFQTVRGMLNLDDQVKPLDIQELLRELFNRSLLLKTQDGRYQYQPLVQQYSQQQVTDLCSAHEKAIAYYLLHTKASPWQTLDDVTEYLEIFYHYCELQQYAQAFATIYGDCNNFWNLLGYNNFRVELYGRLVQEWQPSNQDETWNFAASLTSLGNASYSLGKYQQAIEYHQQSLKIFQEIGEISSLANSLMGLGNASDSLGEYQQAIEYHQQSLKIKQDIGEISGIARSLNNLGNASDSLGKYQQAIEYHQQSLKIFQEIGEISSLANSLMGLGNASYSLGEYQQAIEYYQQSLKIFQEIGDRRGEANSWFNLADTLNKLNREQDAIGAYRNARALYQAMELNEYVQRVDNAIQEIETSLAKASHPTARNWLLAAFSFIWCPVQNLWGIVRGWFRR